MKKTELKIRVFIKFDTSRLIYLSGGENPAPVNEALKMVDSELANPNPFQMDQWPQLSQKASEQLGIKDLSAEVKNRAIVAINSLLNQNSSTATVRELTNYAFREVKKFLEGLKDKLFAERTKTVIDTYRRYKGVKRDVSAAKIVSQPVEPVMRVSDEGLRADKVEKLTRGYSATEKMISEGTKVAELISEGVLDAETAFKMGLRVDGVIGSESVLRVIRDGVMTLDEAKKMGFPIQVVKFVPSFLARLGLTLEQAAMLTNIVRIGSRFAVVTNLALSMRDVYDQSKKLSATLNSEGTGNAFEKAAAIVEHTTEMEANRSATRDTAERKVLEEKDLSQKLEGTRIMAVQLTADATTYGMTSVDTTNRSMFQSAEHFVKGVVSAPTEALASAILGGSPEDKRKGAEKKSIERSLANAENLVAQLN